MRVSDLKENSNSIIRNSSFPRSGSKDDGFTLIEIILVIIITGLLAMLFSQTLVSSIQIYNEHNYRKNAHIDLRRSFDMFMHDVREWESWYGGQQPSEINFDKYNRFRYTGWGSNRNYYTTVRVGYRFSGTQMAHRRDEDGSWNNHYLLIYGGIVPGATSFSAQNQGGMLRLSAVITMTVLNKPIRMRTTVFPRSQGG